MWSLQASSSFLSFFSFSSLSLKRKKIDLILFVSLFSFLFFLFSLFLENLLYNILTKKINQKQLMLAYQSGSKIDLTRINYEKVTALHYLCGSYQQFADKDFVLRVYLFCFILFCFILLYYFFFLFFFHFFHVYFLFSCSLFFFFFFSLVHPFNQQQQQTDNRTIRGSTTIPFICKNKYGNYSSSLGCSK